MIDIAAILIVRNGAPTLARVLSHLADNQIALFAVDHGSTDETARILEEFSPNPVVDVTRVPFDGVHRWQANLELKTEIANKVPHDWIIHVDADEIMESPTEGESLREFIERMDRAGADLIECDEFVFLPTDETEHHSKDDFVETMRRYYYFAPKRFMHRAIRTGTGPIDWAQSGGHNAGVYDRTVADERMRLRHYVGLSIDHLRQQYLGRVFGATELRKGWHRNRVATTPQFVVVPPSDRLLDLDSDGWRTDQPETKHLIFNQPHPYRPPEPVEPDTTRAPIPFVVGVGRSGTTLLRLMLDSHPDLAMTPETHWLGSAISTLRQDASDRDALRNTLISNDIWADMGIEDAQLDAILEGHDPRSPFDTLRAIYRTYANAHEATRVGDKTPVHGLAMTKIVGALPEARFIHVIRDGRDVAVSHRGLWFGPGDDVRDAAVFWLWRIREMRQQFQFVPYGLEVRYEDLVIDPESELRRIDEFIDLPFSPEHMTYPSRAADRLSEIRGRNAKSGFVSGMRRRSIHRRTEELPDPSRIGRWRTEMSPADVMAFESIAGTMLVDLGYELSGYG